jgi:HD-GYP domain-containing protein (c-di-GMP phosphodiesterase class II)
VDTTKVKAYMAQEQMQRTMLESLLNRLNDLNAIGASLSSERNIDKLLENILSASMKITNADAGTLYLLDVEKQELTFEILRNRSLGISMGGTSGEAIPFYPIHLIGKDGQPNHAMVVSHAALSGETVNIPDAYIAAGFDFTGTKHFDAKTGYRSRSFLAVPMRNHEHEVIGVLQLINALDDKGGVQQFSMDDQKLLESLASQAAIAISNRRLILQMEELFESFIKLINTAIDDKSPYTGGHCARVPALTMMLAEAASRSDRGGLKEFKLTDQDRYELKMAGLLHDCGKITTPVHVVDKATKLHTLFDRIQLLDTRFEVLKRDAEISMLRGESNQGEYESRVRQLDDDREFLRRTNIGGEKMSDADIARVRAIAAYPWRDVDGEMRDFLSEDETENLTIRAGTLTAEEREIINHHIVVTIKMLESLPWPKHLKHVPEYAGGHHERMDGKGYPKGLKREQMSVQARLMGIADIFEALTAKDRPYKEGKTLTESLTILGYFKESGHIDTELFDAFIREKVYLEYAKQFLAPEQIDEVDETRIPGYTP